MKSSGSPAGNGKGVVFHNRQALGDILTMTCGVRDFKMAFPDVRVGVLTTARHIWDNNPYVDLSFEDENKILKIGPTFLTNKSNRWNLHMCNAFRMDIENKMGLQIPQGNIRPDIWLTEEEYEREPLIEGPYWMIVVGGEPGWTAKMYPMERWQEVVDSLPEVRFVQLGLKGHPFPHLENVTDYIGRTEDKDTGIRDLFNVFLRAQGSLGLVSFHMHLSAAFNNPCVVVAGAREPAWFTQYYGHQYLQTNGALSCGERKACWKCAVEACRDHWAHEEAKIEVKPDHKNEKWNKLYGGIREEIGQRMPKCIDMIHPREVVTAIRKYYDGGRLKYGEKIKNTFFGNVVKEKKIFVVPRETPIDESLLDRYGLQWGNGAITHKDWPFMESVLDKYNVRSVLEFGVGLSSLLMMNKVDVIVSYETDLGWIDKIKQKANEKLDIRCWDGKIVREDLPRFDLAFVDGPAGGENREFSTRVASEKTDIVIVHDAGREPERRWQEKYLENDFEMISKGGHRCHLWKRKSDVVVDLGKPLARMVTTCRGFGGSERSSIHIMDMLLSRGYRVELVPIANLCGEYERHLSKDVRVTKWQEIPSPADLLILYCSDAIWGFDEQRFTDCFGNIKADRKVMVLNYQLGGAGKAEWTKDWDKYLFLNSTKQWEFQQRLSSALTMVLPPPTDLTEFFKIKVSFNDNLRLIRHSAQGDVKHPGYTNRMIQDVLENEPSAEFYYMPARSDTMEHLQVHKFGVNEISLPEFLSKGNLFWYHLPPGYQDQGPRVVMEAMAAGLPIIADNRYGAKDRITSNAGWLCDTYEEYLKIISNVTPEILKEKGKAAREIAQSVFRPERWTEEICGDN